MMTQAMYHPFHPDHPSPEASWVSIRMALKERELQQQRVQLDAHDGFGAVFKLRVAIVQMTNLEQVGALSEVRPSIWRRLLVSANITLRALHDQVIGPAFGWRRGYHCYMFTDIRDGAIFGPRRCGANDWMHLPYRAGCRAKCVLDDEFVRLGEVVGRPGDRLLYTYDLGDSWQHMITVESTLPHDSHKLAKLRSFTDPKGWEPAFPDARRVLDGQLACPPEDSVGFQGMGSSEYEKEVLLPLEVYVDRSDAYQPHEYKLKGGKRLSPQKRRTIERAANYAGGGAPFDPLAFDRAAAQARMDAAVRQGAPLDPAEYAAGNPHSRSARSGETFVRRDHQGKPVFRDEL